MKIELKQTSSNDWLKTVLQNFDAFLLDHAACERKASSMAMSMLAHYPDKPLIVQSMMDLAAEELQHFRQVMRLILERKLVMPPDVKDPYVGALRAAMRKQKLDFFLDRLLVAGIIEARGHERFAMIADALDDDKLKTFYEAIARSEARHHELFIKLAEHYFSASEIQQRLTELLALEANIVAQLPPRAALH